MARSSQTSGRRLLLVAAVAGLFVAGFTGVAAADAALSVTGTSLPSSVTQGDAFDLTVAVSGEELQNDKVDVSLTLPAGLSCSPSGAQTVTLTGGTADATFDCDADAAGDYTGQITATATATNVNNGNSIRDSTQTGLEVQSPASLSLTTSLGRSTIDVESSTTLTAVVQNSGDVSTSYSFSIAAPNGVDSSIASGSSSGTVSGSSTASVEWSLTGASGGDYTITTSVTGGNGQTLQETDALTVNDPSGGGTGGGSGGGTGTGGPTPTIATTAVTEQLRSSVSTGTSVTVAIHQVSTSNPMMNVAVDAATDQGLSVRNVSANFETGTDSINTMTVEATSSPPTNVPEPPDEDADRTLGYVSVNIDGDLSTQVTGGSFTVQLDRAGFGDVDATAVMAMRYHDGEWQRVETTAVNASVVRITTPGFSTFALMEASQETPTPEPSPEETPTPEVTEPASPTPEPTTRSQTPEPTPTPPPTTSTPGAGGPGFGLLATVLAISLLGLRLRHHG